MTSMDLFQSRNPTDGVVFAQYATLDSVEVATVLARAQAAAPVWARFRFEDRAARLGRMAADLRATANDLATLLAREMGKPVGEGLGEVEKCAWVCDFFGANGAGMLAPQSIASDASRSEVRFEPLGGLLAIMPWNFPLWQLFRAAAPALMAGNVVLLKPAPNVPGITLELVRLFREAGFPDGVFQTLFVAVDDLEPVMAHPAVAAATLTGSERAGRSLAALAGRYLKKSVLELGGSDPFIVLEDAPVPETAKAAATARCLNAGQSCIAAKRFLVVESIAEAFTEALAQALLLFEVGDPLQAASVGRTRVGPLARQDLVENLERQVRESIRLGAQLRIGGTRAEGPGYFYPPTLLTQCRPGMPVMDEETFGPVAAVMAVRDAKQALSVANDTRYGLGASVWTQTPASAEPLLREIKSGAVFVNGIVKSDPRLPFGGVKQSGHGRELSTLGIHEFVNAKTVWIA